MRTEMNPERLAKAKPMPKVVMAMITHVPNLEGYHSKRMDVVNLAIRSMIYQPGMDAELLIWDNGSCKEAVEMLDNFKPDTLILSANVGKQSARAAIYRMYPPETIIALSDDDMLFYPGWLKACVDVLNHFPNVGIVSGYPVRTQARWGIFNTLQWGRKYASVQTGKIIQEEWDRDFCTSIGRDYQKQLMTTVDDVDHLINYRGMSAFAMGHHCQQVAIAGRVVQFYDWNDAAMGDEKPYDIAIDNAGLLRLTTRQRYARHIGNVLDDGVIHDAVKIGVLHG